MGRDSMGGRRWRGFFIYVGGAAILLIGVCVWATEEIRRNRPSDCPSCGTGAVGLVPVYLSTAGILLTLLFGFMIWLYQRYESREARTALAIVAVVVLSALASWIALSL